MTDRAPEPLGPAPTPRRDRTPAVLTVVLAALAGLLVVAAAVAVPRVLDAGEGGGTKHAVAVGERTVDLSEVQEYDGLRLDHVVGDVTYPQVPPVGGPHDPAWLDCGVYDEPVRDANAVHDLEHGTVWITHDPDLPAADVRVLADRLPRNGLLSPYPGLPAPVVVTVWGRQLRLEGADDPRLPLFLREYGGGVTAPEPFASCAGGLTDGGGAPPGTPV